MNPKNKTWKPSLKTIKQQAQKVTGKKRKSLQQTPEQRDMQLQTQKKGSQNTRKKPKKSTG